jgi:hypothetical protein
VNLDLERQVTHGHCKKAAREARKRTPCTKAWEQVKSLSEAGSAGANTYSGLFKGLRAGIYQVAMTPVNASGVSGIGPVFAFTVRKP